MSKVLIVDDEFGARRVLEEILREDDHEIEAADGYRSAQTRVTGSDYDVVLTDQRMPDGSGLDVIKAVSRSLPNTPTVMITSDSSIDLAVRAMREGAYDFITKPFEPDVVRKCVDRASQHRSLKSENQILQHTASAVRSEYKQLVGRSDAIHYLRDMIARAAPTNATILIEGETGSGKELVARHIHDQSHRRNKPFVPINCAAIPDALLESQLFGHEKGAFTGANTAHPGLFEMAHGGTIFLDEIGELPYPLQAKLLRVLVDGEILRVGAQKTRTVDVRLIAATHRDVESMRVSGEFREDLYFRISVVPMRVPSLRERPTDIALLAHHFLQKFRESLARPNLQFDDSALAALSSYSFPGNVRELRNLIERACILGLGDVLTDHDFPIATSGVSGGAVPKMVIPQGDINLREYLETIERLLLENTLNATDGNQAEAGRRLGLSRSDMNYRLKKYELSSPGSSA